MLAPVRFFASRRGLRRFKRHHGSGIRRANYSGREYSVGYSMRPMNHDFELGCIACSCRLQRTRHAFNLRVECHTCGWIRIFRINSVWPDEYAITQAKIDAAAHIQLWHPWAITAR